MEKTLSWGVQAKGVRRGVFLSVRASSDSQIPKFWELIWFWLNLIVIKWVDLIEHLCNSAHPGIKVKRHFKKLLVHH